MSPGHWLVNLGSSVSAIVTLNVRMLVLPLKAGLVQANCLPALSTAVQVTVVVPVGNAEPDGGLHENDFTPEQ